MDGLSYEGPWPRDTDLRYLKFHDPMKKFYKVFIDTEKRKA